MKARMNIRSIILVMAIIGLASMFFINICFATSTGKISTETARLREQPNTDSKVLELASYGENVEILEEIDGWYKVKYQKITGYIRNDLIEVENKVDENTTNIVENNEITENQQTTENTIISNQISEETNETIENNETFEKGKYQLAYNVKLRIVPLINAVELGEVEQGTEVEVTEILNHWVKIKTQDGKEGWVVTQWTNATGEKIIIFSLSQEIEDNNQTPAENEKEQTSNVIEKEPEQTSRTMYVNSQTINFREQPNTSSKVLRQLSLNQEVTVISSENGWCKVDVNGVSGYISQSLLSDAKKETSRGGTTDRPVTQNENTSTTINENTSNNTTTETETNQTELDTSIEIETPNTVNGNDIITYAKQFLGYKYVYGGTTPNGFDCSGFTQYVYKHFGININRTAAAQYSNGTSVTNLQAGDLVMFGKSGINHVGIYIGGNTFIHAANSKRGVTTDTLASGYYKTNYVGARRII